LCASIFPELALMKMLFEALRWALVWMVICLLAVDPAAACRLLAGRCCRCVCCAPACDGGSVVEETPTGKTAEPGEATEPVKPDAQTRPTERSEPSPSDAPPGALPPAAPPDSIQPRQSQAPAKRERSESGARGEISQQAAAPGRRPTAETPAPVTEATTAEVSASSESPSRELKIDPSPSAATLAGPQATEPSTIDSNAAAAPAAPPAAGAVELQPIPMTPRRTAEVPMPDARPLEPVIGSRSPALPGAVNAGEPVAEPAFPPTDDDPFAPVAPNRGPAVKQPDADDPFAPLPPAAPQSRRQAASPTTVQRGWQLADPLLPAADGRLAVREWADASGQFRIQARLIQVLEGKVRLLKDTGRTTTVALEKLSSNDRAYVAEVVARYGSDLTKLDQLAAR
jgi:hypothetical protein